MNKNIEKNLISSFFSILFNIYMLPLVYTQTHIVECVLVFETYFFIPAAEAEITFMPTYRLPRSSMEWKYDWRKIKKTGVSCAKWIV